MQGFYQTTAPDSAWTLSSPGQTLNAQLIKRGASPEIVAENIRITWELGPLTTLQGAGQDKEGQRRGTMEPGSDGMSFTANIPVTARQTDGVLNPYPLVTLTAEDASSGTVLARSAAVLAVSPGYGCAHCHTDAGKAILEVHDRHQSTAFLQQAGQGQTIDCRSCHSGLVSEPQSGKEQEQSPKMTAGGGLSVSAAIHGWHAPYLLNRESDACLTCHTGLGRSRDDDVNPPRPLFARDFHVDRGLNCVNCHGALEDHALALLAAEKAAGQGMADPAMARIKPRAVTAVSEIKPRLPWVQEPDCTGCHDFSAKPRLGTASGFNQWTENQTGLFSRRSDNMEAVRCSACHGAPHAVYPARNPVGRDRDNIPPLQYQQHARALGAVGNCALCHMEDKDYSAHHPLVERKRTMVRLPEGVRPTLPGVGVSHQAHEIFPCRTCHHTGHEDGRSMACTSSGCHDSPSRSAVLDGRANAPEKGEPSDNLAQAARDAKADVRQAAGNDVTTTETNPAYFRYAFHGPGNSCFGCHSSALRTGEPAGPTSCKDCHRAPSPRWSSGAAPSSGAGSETAQSTRNVNGGNGGTPAGVAGMAKDTTQTIH